MRILPKGQLADDHTTADILANDQLLKAADYKPLIVAYHNGAAVRLSDIANVQDGVENIRTAGFLNGKPSVPLIILRQPGANIIETVDRIKAALPSLKASIPAAIELRRGARPHDDHSRVGSRRSNARCSSPSRW